MWIITFVVFNCKKKEGGGDLNDKESAIEWVHRLPIEKKARHYIAPP